MKKAIACLLASLALSACGGGSGGVIPSGAGIADTTGSTTSGAQTGTSTSGATSASNPAPSPGSGTTSTSASTSGNTGSTATTGSSGGFVAFADSLPAAGSDGTDAIPTDAGLE